MDHGYWLEQAIRLAKENASKGEGPFAALVVKDGRLVSTGVNRVQSEQDPTAHAELSAIREACRQLHTADLSDCILYASGEPCPMCTGAIYWARLRAVYYACSKAEAREAAGFEDPLGSFYAEMARAPHERAIPIHHLDVPGKLEPFYVHASLSRRAED